MRDPAVGLLVLLLGLSACSSLAMRPTDTGLAKGSKGLGRVVLIFPTLGISEMTIRGAEDREAVARGEMTTSESEQRAADRRAIWSTLLGAAARDSSH